MTKPPRISLAEMARQSGAMLRRGDSAHFDPGRGLPPTLADLTESLFFSPGDGRIWLNDQRMLLCHSSAMGHLRRELIDTLGMERARGLLTRAGYVCGARDAQLVRERWPDGDAASVFMAGTRLHALEGRGQGRRRCPSSSTSTAAPTKASSCGSTPARTTSTSPPTASAPSRPAGRRWATPPATSPACSASWWSSARSSAARWAPASAA